MKKHVLVLLVLALMVASLSAAPLTIKLAHLNPQEPFDVPSAAMAATFKSEVEANSNGEILVDIYPNGVLGKEREDDASGQSRYRSLVHLLNRRTFDVLSSD